MTEAIENTQPLEGILEIPQQRQRIFKSFKALQDFCNAFGIVDYNSNTGVLQNTNEKVNVLTYVNTQGE